MKQIKERSPVSIIIPVLNEADNLQLLFQRIDKALRMASIPYEIVVVDDHSTDGTVSLINGLKARYNVRFYIKKDQPGKAFSLLEGFELAKFDLVCMIDGDLQYPPEAIPAMFNCMDQAQADIVLTERIDNKTSLARRASSVIYNFLFVRLLFGIKYDTQSGLKLFKKKILEKVSLSPSPWSFDLEFIVRSLEQDYSIISYPIPFGERYAGVPKVKLLSATAEIIRATIKLRRITASKRVRLNYRNLQLMQRSFNWLVAFLAAIALAVGLNTTVYADAYQPTASDTYKTQPAKHGFNKLINDLEKSFDINQGKDKKDMAYTTTSNPTGETAAKDNNRSALRASSNSENGNSVSQTTVPSTSTSNNPSSGVSSAPAASTATPVSVVPSASSLTSSSGTGSASTVKTKNTAYYIPSKLGGVTTQKFLKIALALVEAGGIFLALGIIALAVRPVIIRKQQRHLLRS